MTKIIFRFLEPKTERDELINPYWIEDKDLKRGEVDYLSGPEIQFWKDLLDKYLYPIDENKEQQVITSITVARNLFNFTIEHFFVTGTNCGWFNRITKQVRLFLLHVQCSLHFDRLLATIEQRRSSRRLAPWSQNKHHLHRRNIWGTLNTNETFYHYQDMLKLKILWRLGVD